MANNLVDLLPGIRSNEKKMETNATQNWLSPPGDTILETMEYVGLSKKELAEKLVLSLDAFDLLLEGKLAINSELAISLEKAFDIPASFWKVREENFRNELSNSKIF
jgi:HTH-type transcriptional regulator/antitoxin HigA